MSQGGTALHLYILLLFPPHPMYCFSISSLLFRWNHHLFPFCLCVRKAEGASNHPHVFITKLGVGVFIPFCKSYIHPTSLLPTSSFCLLLPVAPEPPPHLHSCGCFSDSVKRFEGMGRMVNDLYQILGSNTIIPLPKFVIQEMFI